MPSHLSTWLLVGFLVVFAVFLLLRSAGSRPPAKAQTHPAWRRLDEQRRAAKAAGHGAAAAEHWRQAASLALEELGRPELAAKLALRAERANPQHESTWPLLLRALRGASRHRALERLLWRQMAQKPAGSEAYRQALAELLALYDGPLRRPERALVLRRLHEPHS